MRSRSILHEQFKWYMFLPLRTDTEWVFSQQYVDDLNLIGTPKELRRTVNFLKREFEMKDLGKMKFCLGLQLEQFPKGFPSH